MKANQMVGSSTEYKHYLKIKKDIKAGLVPKEFLSGFQELEDKYKFVEYAPPYFIKKAWDINQEIRSVKPFESPINYTDLYHYQQMMRIEISPSEVRLILLWDTLWYKYYNKYHNGK